MLTTMSMFPDMDKPALILPVNTKVIVSLSGGKDSVATLLVALETFGTGNVLAHHQIVLEDWPNTVEYNQEVCSRLDVPFYASQGIYQGYECNQCKNHYLSSSSLVWCRACGSREGTHLDTIDSVLDLVKWRQKWPSLDVRFCTSYFKRDVFNMWARANKTLLGESPVLAMGERWRESKGRSRLPYLRLRSGMQWLMEWRPILDYRRIDVFRKMRDYNITPHYCYEVQGMTSHEMYEVNQENGPRMSCVMCFLKSGEQMKASYQSEEGRAIIERGVQIEEEINHTIKKGQSLKSMIA